ncbi:hypothetical protein BDW74DRAFT_160876 [Aspergillus multicolor]|uniref:uncharacterized protein n=1 Tax=Aspergillus multicolor TaxID=41759 RepID=UPI003CCE4836
MQPAQHSTDNMSMDRSALHLCVVVCNCNSHPVRCPTPLYSASLGERYQAAETTKAC